MERHGTDYWWELPVEKLLGRDLQQELNCNINDLERGNVCESLLIFVKEFLLTYFY